MSAGFQAETIRRRPTEAVGSALTALIPSTTSRDLVDRPAVGRLPRPPLLAVDRAELAVLVGPLVPDGDAVLLQVARCSSSRGGTRSARGRSAPKGTFLVVTSGKPSARSNRIWRPKTLSASSGTSVPSSLVRVGLHPPRSRMWRKEVEILLHRRPRPTVRCGRRDCPRPSGTRSGGSTRRCPCRRAGRAGCGGPASRSLPPEKPVQPKVVRPLRLAHSTARRMFGLLPEPLMAMSRSPGEARFLSCSTKTRSKPSSLPQARM